MSSSSSAATTTTRNKYTLHWRERDDSDAASTSDDEDKRIRLPNLKYGYRTEPFAWEELYQIMQGEQPRDLAKLSRSVTQQRDYEIYKRDLLQKWVTVMDHVLCEKFPDVFSPVAVQDGRFVADPPLTEATQKHAKNPKLALFPNDFPYYMVPGLEHWVLWKLGGDGLCNEEEIAQAKAQLVTSRNMDPLKILHWVNPPNLQSLPSIDHVHIIGEVINNTRTSEELHVEGSTNDLE